MGRQHPPKINTEEPKKREYPSIGRMSPKKTVEETIEKTPRKNKPKQSN